MSLGTDAMKGWWGPLEYTTHSGEVPWLPCKREPGLKAATNQHHHTEGTYLTPYQPQTTSYEGWKGLGAESAK